MDENLSPYTVSFRPLLQNFPTIPSGQQNTGGQYDHVLPPGRYSLQINSSMETRVHLQFQQGDGANKTMAAVPTGTLGEFRQSEYATVTVGPNGGRFRLRTNLVITQEEAALAMMDVLVIPMPVYSPPTT